VKRAATGTTQNEAAAPACFPLSFRQLGASSTATSTQCYIKEPEEEGRGSAADMFGLSVSGVIGVYSPKRGNTVESWQAVPWTVETGSILIVSFPSRGKETDRASPVYRDPGRSETTAPRRRDTSPSNRHDADADRRRNSPPPTLRTPNPSRKHPRNTLHS
jgi:hypothetical protein